MRFTRITENQSYCNVLHATDDLWKNGIRDKAVREHPDIIAMKLDFSRCTTPGMGMCGEGEYSGVIVTDGDTGYRVIDIHIDTLATEKTEIVDITDSLGELDPAHHKCDIRNPVPMAILYYLELFGELPKNALRHLQKDTNRSSGTQQPPSCHIR